jgi:hypothetical protein
MIHPRPIAPDLLPRTWFSMIWIMKLADRITNLQPQTNADVVRTTCPPFGDHALKGRKQWW